MERDGDKKIRRWGDEVIGRNIEIATHVSARNDTQTEEEYSNA